ncbi:DUF2505 domain-containing protein [Goodfellowiella coeruleoviolacea]|uniref:DUF2505 domain-containing protein n=1 Tax=Goodfellowiella coeruleoviolacea TaxID=334858 RepID=A0AAE3GDC2_9PSEU|nr:DUF2505 domain-containing protein [Goodfellowiella coeruleoviolacea]MCP2166030.1 Protein of unknown function (DUF2505) [Goodfellowiella coeruleoviolacea]
MARRVEHRTVSSFSAGQVHGALVDPEYLRDRLAVLGGTQAGVVEHRHTDGVLRFQLRQGVAAAKLPSVARRFLGGGDLILTREETWTAGAGEYVGEVTVSMPRVPGRFSGRMRLADLAAPAGGCELVLHGEASVAVPLVGGKLEQLVAEQVSTLLTAESEFTDQWLSRRRG